MNAVKRCLALIAATLVVGACGGDPTVDDAGTDLSIRATPGAVWVRNNTSATVNIEAVDKLGGPAAGSWTVGTIVGPMTVALDTAYQNTTVGSLGLKSRFVVTPTAEGDGSVTFTGTGGSILVPVRVSPDTGAFAVAFSTPTPALGEVVTATAPAGIRFTSSTALSFYDGPLAGDLNNGLAAPAIVSMSADSTQLSFVNAPAAGGQVKFTGLASISTPGLTTSARSVGTVTGATQDTTALPVTLNNAAPTVTDTVVATIAAPYRFTASDNGLTITPTSGGASPLFVGFSADSSQVQFVLPPGASGQVRFPRVVFINGPAVGFAGRSTATLTAAPPPPLSATFSSTTPAANAPITITMPAGFKFRPSSQLRFGSAGMSWIVTARAADSSSVTVIPEPGVTNGTVQITNVQLSAAPGFSLTLDATTTITTGAAATDLGADYAIDDGTAPVASLVATLTPGTDAGFYDLATFEAADWLGFGTLTNSEQDFKITFTNAGSYTVFVDWGGGSAATDLDIAGTDAAIENFTGTALTGNKPESFTFTATAGQQTWLMVGFYDGPTPAFLKIHVRRNS